MRPIDLITQLLELLVALAAAPLFVGWVNQCRAWLQNRSAPSLWLPYRGIRKLFHKDAVIAESASRLFRLSPYIVFAAMVVAAGIIPSMGTRLPLTRVAPDAVDSRSLCRRSYSCVPHKQTARSGVTPKRAEVFFPQERLVSQLRRDLTLFVHFAKRAFRNNAVATSGAQDAGRHHPGRNERIRIFDRHVVSEFISNTREFLDDVHVGGMEEASSSQPRRIDE